MSARLDRPVRERAGRRLRLRLRPIGGADRLGVEATSGAACGHGAGTVVGTMSDPLTWSPISLGRWFGTTVRVHITLIVFVVFTLVLSSATLAAKGELAHLPHTACWLGLLLLALALHELAHAATAAWLDCDQDDVHIWPLGSLVGPSFVPRSSEHIVVAVAGPVTSGALFLVTAVCVSLFGGAQVVWNPFGNELDAGAPILPDGKPAATPFALVGRRLVRLSQLRPDAGQPAHPGLAV